jgi:hypothetical protein
VSVEYIHRIEEENTDDLRQIYQWTSSYYLYETRDNKLDEAAGRFLTWLGLAAPDSEAPTGYRPSDFLFQVKNELSKKRRRSQRHAAYDADIDVFESAYEGAFGNTRLDPAVKRFLADMLSLIGLVRFTKGDEAIPTRFLRKLVATVRQQDRYERDASKREQHEWDHVDQVLALAKERGRRIDPEIAEAWRTSVQVLDPYGIAPNLPPFCNQIGRDSFARSPRGEWVWEGDLPREIMERIDERYSKAQASAAREKGEFLKRVAEVHAQNDDEDEEDDA